MELVVVRREKGDLVQRLQERMETLQGSGKPFWPSAAQRYCTSDLKRGPINKYLRRFDYVISAEGIRAEESPARARRPEWEVRRAIATRSRRAYTWNPLLHWSIDQVWEACGTSTAELARRRELYRRGSREEALDGWPCHPAYVYGTSRLSCAICILASRNDIAIGAQHNPELLRTYAEMERRSGFSFRQDLALLELEKKADGG